VSAGMSESPLEPLRFLAARLVLGEVRTDELPDEATALLVEGLDSGSLRALAGQDRWDGDRSRDLLGDALKESGSAMPTGSEARRMLAEYLVRSLAEGRRDPYSACREIWSKAWNFGDEDTDLTPFVGLATEWEESPESERSAIEDDMRQAAWDYLNRS